jgi:hypothetical protein
MDYLLLFQDGVRNADAGCVFCSSRLFDEEGTGAIMSTESEVTKRLRDHFATAVLPTVTAYFLSKLKDVDELGEIPDMAAKYAFVIADAVLEARDNA